MKNILLFIFFCKSISSAEPLCAHCNTNFSLPPQPMHFSQNFDPNKYPNEKIISDKKFGDIVIKKQNNKNDRIAFSILTKHYDFYLEGDNLDPLDTAKLLEAAWKVKKDFFQASPPEGERLKIEMYANKQNYLEGLKRDKLGEIDSGGYYWEGNKKAYLWWQTAGIEFSRYLLLHEAAHQFEHLCNKKTRLAKFWVEGIADFLGMHHWNGESIKLGATMNSHLLRDKASKALLTYSNIDNDFQSILQRQNYNYDESWGIVHFLLHHNKEKGRRLFNNMLKSNSLEDSWQKTFNSKNLHENFHKELIQWLTEMKKCPKETFFVSWGNIWFGWEKAIELRKLLRKKCPESLNNLISEMENLTEKGTESTKMKKLFMGKSAPLILDLIINDIPSYRIKNAFSYLTETDEEITKLKKECLKLTFDLQKQGNRKDALKIFTALSKAEVKEAGKMLITYDTLLLKEKEKAVEFLKIRKFYEAYIVYRNLCKIFPKSKDLAIHKIKDKLLSSENSKADIKSAELYIKIFNTYKSRKYKKEKLRKECLHYISNNQNSRFVKKVQKIFDYLKPKVN